MGKRIKPGLPTPTCTTDLPFKFDIPGRSLRVSLEKLQKSHLPYIHKLWEEEQVKGDGFGHGDDISCIESEILDKSNPFYIGLVLVNVVTREVIAVQYTLPSPLCRSQRPVFAGGIIIVNDSYRASRLSTYMTLLPSWLVLPQYRGILTRTVVTGQGALSAIKSGCIFTGIIPWCTSLAKKGWVHDNIVLRKVNTNQTNDDDALMRNLYLQKLSEKLPSMPKLPAIRRQTLPRSDSSLHHHKFGQLRIESANEHDYLKIQQIIRDAAITGEGFGLDEFTGDGFYNEKLIRNCSYWIVTRESTEELLAIILTGDTGLTRSSGSSQAAGTIIVLRPYRHQGLGEKLFNFCQTQAAIMGYKAILTDILSSNKAGLSLVQRQGFLITGTIHETCFHLKYGYTDAYILWKDITQPVNQSKL